MEGIRVTRSLTIPWDEITLRFSPSGGPGGQHANKASTRVELEWNVATSRVLGPRQRDRIRANLKNRIDSSGTLRLASDRHRSQLRNRNDVAHRLADFVAGALTPTRKRVPTRPTRSAVERRLEGKRRRSQVKRARRVSEEDR